jgi:hypothetical protein
VSVEIDIEIENSKELIELETDDTSEDTEVGAGTGDIASVKSPYGNGRPVGTGRYGTRMVVLRNTDKDGYRGMKDLLEYFPHTLSEKVMSTSITHSKIHDVAEFAQGMMAGAISVSPLVCKGDSCPYASRCEILINDIAPVGSSCPVELMLIDRWAEEWVRTMEVDLTSKVEKDQVASIIMCDLMLMRLGNRLALSPTGNIVYTPVGVDKNGSVILRMEAAPEIAMQEKYLRMKTSVQESLLATRESKAKHGVMEDRDLAKKAAKAMHSGQQLMAQISKNNKVLAETIFSNSDKDTKDGGK